MVRGYFEFGKFRAAVLSRLPVLPRDIEDGVLYRLFHGDNHVA
jgi:hypothetical protein